MLEHSAMMFDKMKSQMKHLKKKNYETNMAEFLKEHGHYFKEMTDYMEASESKEDAAREIAVCFVNEVENKFATGKRSRVPQHIQVDLNFFMIYYVFPAILKTEHEQCKVVADAICSEWGTRFKDSKIWYTDYDTLFHSFREKIFGIF